MRVLGSRKHGKLLILLYIGLFFSFLIFAYTRIGSPANDRSVRAQQAATAVPTVILLSQMRSGSSVVGELFNRRSDVSYFYEPLYPFGMRHCEGLLDDRLEVLRSFASCKFDPLDHLYQKAFRVSKLPDIAGCKEHKICFTAWEKMSLFLDRDAHLCKKQICPQPIDLEALAKHCRQSLLVALKVIYLCKLKWLMPLLQDSNLNVKVVHLVRDPRATVRSRMVFQNAKGVNGARNLARHVCDRMAENVHFAESSGDPLMASKYLRIRHEDFATNPVETAQKVYDFVGINMNPSVVTWLRDATSAQNNVNLSRTDGQSTTRNAAHVVTAWRKLLSVEEILTVQKQCAKQLEWLGYHNLRTKEEMLDLEAFPSF